MLSALFGYTHPPPPVLVGSLQEVTSQEESFMPAISGYIWERVKLEEMLKFLRCELWPIIRNQLFWQAIGREQSMKLVYVCK